MWKDFFSFTNKEKNGIWGLIGLIIFVILINFSLPYWVKPPNQTDFSAYQGGVDEFMKSLEPKNQEYYDQKQIEYLKNRYDTLELFTFDPNTTTPEQWEKLGLSKRQIEIISNYINKGGRFYEKEDLSNIYGISPYQYQQLVPYIKLPKRHKAYKKQKKETWKKNKRFNFDPNIVSESELHDLGFTQKQIRTLTNYRANGGQFYKKEDLKKIYGIKTEQYLYLESYIKIEKKEEEKKTNPTQPVAINIAGKNQLVHLPGVDYNLAETIIKYRNYLGGYVDKQQLLEVYGMKRSTYNDIKKYINIDTGNVKKININFANTKELAAHPYISFSLANKIIDYRTRNGSFQIVKQLLDKKVVTQKQYGKISPYLTVK